MSAAPPIKDKGKEAFVPEKAKDGPKKTDERLPARDRAAASPPPPAKS